MLWTNLKFALTAPIPNFIKTCPVISEFYMQTDRCNLLIYGYFYFLQTVYSSMLTKGYEITVYLLFQVTTKIAQCLSHWTLVGSCFESFLKKCWNESQQPYWQNFTQETPDIPLQSRCMDIVHFWNVDTGNSSCYIKLLALDPWYFKILYCISPTLGTYLIICTQSIVTKPWILNIMCKYLVKKIDIIYNSSIFFMS